MVATDTPERNAIAEKKSHQGGRKKKLKYDDEKEEEGKTWKKKKNSRVDESTKEEELPEKDRDDGSSDVNLYEELTSSDEENITDVTVGKWVLVGYKTKKTILHYTGKIVDIDGFECDVKFLKQVRGQFVWPEKDDVDTILKEDIVTILPEPIVDRRGHHNFQVDLSGRNVL